MNSKKNLLLRISVVFFASAMVITPVLQAFSFNNGQAAELVIGQPNFTSSGISVSANGLVTPTDVAFDAAGNLWIADAPAHRVLRYSAPLTNGQSADLVIGHTILTSDASTNPPTASSLSQPHGIAFDSNGNLFIADSGNNRILRYSPPFTNGEAANFVLGYLNDFTTNAVIDPPTSGSLRFPTDIGFDEDGNFWVADTINNRVLRYDLSFNIFANLVIGQPDFTTGTATASTSAANLFGPSGIDIDSAGNLWVADKNNHRVLRYDAAFTSGEDATLVLGQTTFTSNTSNGGGVSATTLSLPSDVKVDVAGNVLVADSNNHRLLRYDPPASNGESATLVLGQAGFTSLTANAGGISANSLNSPVAASFDSAGNIWTADSLNRRALMYSATVSGSQVTGQVTIAETCGLDIVSGSPINYGTLVPSTTSAEQTLVLENTGSADSILTVKGTDWVDGTSTTQIAVGNTRFSTTASTDYFTKTQLTTADQFVGTITSTTDLNTYWQLEANLIDDSFAGGLTQTMDFTATC